MAIHYKISSMVQEALIEMFLVANFCINFRKDPKIWGSYGCYGYPAAILLFSIADAIGSYVIGGNTRKHFDILVHKDYYNLNLKDEDIDLIYKNYRSLLTHNAALPYNFYLNIGKKNDSVYQIKDGKPLINLLPFFLLTKKVLNKFLNEADKIISKSKTLKEIELKTI